jgi:hypothetical protein
VIYLLVRFEDVATKRIVNTITCDEAEDLQILTVVRHVEDTEWTTIGEFTTNEIDDLPIDWMLKDHDSTVVHVFLLLETVNRCTSVSTS